MPDWLIAAISAYPEQSFCVQRGESDLNFMS
jgi:uncharacterized protein involved in type VI secretion and phage assembly